MCASNEKYFAFVPLWGLFKRRCVHFEKLFDCFAILPSGFYPISALGISVQSYLVFVTSERAVDDLEIVRRRDLENFLCDGNLGHALPCDYPIKHKFGGTGYDIPSSSSRARICSFCRICRYTTRFRRSAGERRSVLLNRNLPSEANHAAPHQCIRSLPGKLAMLKRYTLCSLPRRSSPRPQRRER